MSNKRVAVLISGNGSNLQALIDASSCESYPGDIVVVISNNSKSYGITRAEKHNIPRFFIDHRRKSREQFETEMLQVLQEYNVEWVCLAGFMRVLTRKFINKFRGKILNVHPSLLPKHPGVNALQEALDINEGITGATVHYVDEGVDTGRTLMQKACAIYHNDSIETLKKRVQEIEHELYPRALKFALFAEIEREKK